MLNGYEVILVFAIVLILFGAKKLPELARGLGHGIREFKKASQEATEQWSQFVDQPPSPKPSPQAKLPEAQKTEQSSADK